MKTLIRYSKFIFLSISLIIITGKANSQLKISFGFDCIEYNSILFGRILLDVYGADALRQLIINEQSPRLTVFVDSTGKIVKIQNSQLYSLKISTLKDKIINNTDFYICVSDEYLSDTNQIAKDIGESIIRRGETGLVLAFPSLSMLMDASNDEYNKEKLTKDDFIMRKLEENISIKNYYIQKSSDSIKRFDINSSYQKSPQDNRTKHINKTSSIFVFLCVTVIGGLIYCCRKKK